MKKRSFLSYIYGELWIFSVGGVFAFETDTMIMGGSVSQITANIYLYPDSNLWICYWMTKNNKKNKDIATTVVLTLVFVELRYSSIGSVTSVFLLCYLFCSKIKSIFSQYFHVWRLWSILLACDCLGIMGEYWILMNLCRISCDCW